MCITQSMAKEYLMKYYVKEALISDLERELNKAGRMGKPLSSTKIYAYIEKMEAAAGKFHMERALVRDVAIKIMHLLGENGYNVEAASIAKKFSL